MAIPVLHVVGGQSFEGGTMRYVSSLSAGSNLEFRHWIWKHRSAQPDTNKSDFVLESRATLGGVKTIWRDLKEGLADVVPLIRWARRNPRAILHAHSRCGLIAACLARRVVTNPVVTHFHFFARHWRFFNLLRRTAKAFPIYNSNLTCRHFRGESTPHAVLEPFIPWPESPRSGADNPTHRIVAACAIVPKNNPDVILGAFQRLKAKFTDAELRLYGASPSPMDPTYEKNVIAKAGRLAGASIHPYRHDWLQQLGRRDLFIHLGYPEPFGMAMLEAFACGHPLVIPPVSFFDDLERTDARLAGVERFSELSNESVAIAVERLWSTSTDAEQLWRSRCCWTDRFGAAAAIDRMHSLYRRLTTCKPPVGPPSTRATTLP